MKPTVGIAAVLRAHNPESAFIYREAFVNEAYTSQINKAGGIPYILPYLTEQDIEDQLSHVDGLLVPGGMDLNPSYYGEEKKDYTLPPEDLMDSYQLKLIETALQMNKWVFGICRGFQAINVIHGGTLFQDILTERQNSLEHMRKDSPYEPVHKVTLSKDSHLYKAFGSTEILVNSLHHQGVKQIGNNLNISAVSEDGIIEGVEGDKILAVQWHPEALNSPFFDYIIYLLK